jgi:DNA-binding NarL/FixJ family response regulator
MSERISTLIADDHPVFRRGLREVFDEDKRFAVVGEAVDGAEALKLIKQLRPAVAVLDIRMPHLSGLRVAREVSLGKLSTGIVMLTTHADEELFDEAMALGVLGYVLKENAVTDVLAAVENVANNRMFVSQSIAEMMVGRRTRRREFVDQQSGVKSLSPMERRILRFIATDKTSKEIAGELNISSRTVDTHRQNISQKLNLKGSHSLLKFAFEHRSELQDIE